MEVANADVKVVLVEPGAFKTGIWEENRRDIDSHAGSRYQGAYERTRQGIRLTDVLAGDPATVGKVITRAIGSRAPTLGL